MIKITGILNRITFYNKDNHYTIAKLKTRGIKKTVTIIGHMAGVVEGESLELKGKWINHPKYGEQFKVEVFEVTLPATALGIRKYLGSGMIKGIGFAMADKIVDSFKEKSLDIIENEPERLMQISGIGRAKTSLIVKAWNKHHAIRRVMKFLQDYGIGVTHAAAILQFYGTKAMEILKTKPYFLAKDVPETGFEVADTIALKSGVKKDDPERIKASIIYLILKYENEGHVFAEKTDIIKRCKKLTSAANELIEHALNTLVKEKEIVIEKNPDYENMLCVYIARLYKAETVIASKITAMLSIPIPEYGMNKKLITTEVLKKLGVKLSTEQIKIVSKILSQRVVVITGGPGTGKTTLIRAICAIFKKIKQKVILGASTGRAARRLFEVTDQKASTLHKLLLYDLNNDTFGRNSINPLDLDVLIVDEASMIDTMLMFSLVEAMPLNSFLILVGDIFQLPSIGAGNILSDIIKSKNIKTFALTKIFRQAEKSPIIMNAHAIRKGHMPVLIKKNKKNELSEFYFIEADIPEKIVKTIVKLLSNRIRKAFPHIQEIQVLTPMHKGEAGIINLNQKLQSVLNKNINGIKSQGFMFKDGDKVMHLKNNYEKDIFNGDIGIVHKVIKSESRIEVDYDGRIVNYDIMELDELTLAYAVSVHKSQGSEYSAVVIAMTTMHYPLLQRNLLYTAITRARDLVIIVGSKRAVEIALNNNKTHLRLSGLNHRF